jgi:hypothetical protein
MNRRAIAGAALALTCAPAVLSAMLPARSALAQEHRVFELTVEERRIAVPERTIRVQEGDTVELRIAADEGGELHLHGYDVVIELRAGRTSVAIVDANVPGRFPVTSHGFGSSAHQEGGGRHETLLYLEVYPR